MSEPTERPWFCDQGNDFAVKPRVWAGHADIQKLICECGNAEDPGEVQGEWEANAALIVRAVNSHDALAKFVDQVESLSDRLVNAEYYTAEYAIKDLNSIRSKVARVRAVLARVRESEG